MDQEPSANPPDHLSFFYGDFQALDDISFGVRAQEIFGRWDPPRAARARCSRF